jgi:hypothetical protein
MHLSKNN